MYRFLFSICTFGFLLECFGYHVSAKFTDDVLQSSINRANASPRYTRGVNTPPPIDCKLKSWSAWSTCNACSEKTFRFQNLERPSQFGGRPCFQSQWNESQCPQEGECQLQKDHCGDMFACGPGGRCIGQQLRCNDEIDCVSQNDESDCEVINTRETKCTGMLIIPGAEKATQGYNALTGDFMNHVLDSRYFGGVCEYIYNGEWRKLTYDAFCEHLSYDDAEKYYRKPYNFLSYQIMAQATTEEASEYYEDAVSLLNARNTEESSNFGTSWRVSFVEVGNEVSEEKKFLSKISQYNNKEMGFVRLLSTIQTAQFKMRSKDLTLDEDMLWAMGDLPDQYNFGAYSNFFNEYGTHFVTEGTMGGVLDYVAVVNKNDMKKYEKNGEQLGSCLGFSLGLSQNKAKITTKVKSCEKDGTVDEIRNQSNSAIEDFFGFVKGGHTGSSIGSLGIRDAKSYKDWGKSLKFNPALIEFEILPIYELVRLSTAAEQLRTKLPHMKMAWEEYMENFNPCHCAPCMNNGVPMLSRTACSCVCKNGYRGSACEETERKAYSSAFKEHFFLRNMNVLQIMKSGGLHGRDIGRIGPYRLYMESFESLVENNEVSDEIMDALFHLFSRKWPNVLAINNQTLGKILEGDSRARSSYFTKKNIFENKTEVVGPFLEEGNHWTFFHCSIVDRTITYLNSLGETDEQYNKIAQNWSTFAASKGYQGPWKRVLRKHSLQHDSISCGVFTAVFAEAILGGSGGYLLCSPIQEERERLGILLFSSLDKSGICGVCFYKVPRKNKEKCSTCFVNIHKRCLSGKMEDAKCLFCRGITFWIK